MTHNLTSPITLTAGEFRASWPSGVDFVYTGPQVDDSQLAKPLVTITGNSKAPVRRDGKLPFFSLHSAKGAGGVLLDRLDFVDVDGVQVEDAFGVGIEIQSMRQGSVGKLTNLGGQNVGAEPSILIHSDHPTRGDSTNNCIFNSIEAGQCNHDLMIAFRGGGNQTGAGVLRDVRVNFLWLQAPWTKDREAFPWKARKWLWIDWCLELRIVASTLAMDPLSDPTRLNHVPAWMTRSRHCSIFGTVRQRGAKVLPASSIEDMATCSAIFNFNVDDAVRLV